VGPLGPEAVQQQAQVPSPGVGGAGGPDGRQDAGMLLAPADKVKDDPSAPALAVPNGYRFAGLTGTAIGFVGLG
jgi:hypothetical protein